MPYQSASYYNHIVKSYSAPAPRHTQTHTQRVVHVQQVHTQMFYERAVNKIIKIKKCSCVTQRSSTHNLHYHLYYHYLHHL